MFLLTFSTQALAEWTEFSASTEFSYSFQDNITHAVFDKDSENEQSWNALVSAGRSYQLSQNTRIFASAQIDAIAHKNFHQLNQLSVGGSVTARHKFGIGAFQPWLSSTVTTTHLFSKSKIRERQITTIGFDFGKQLYERFDISLNYRFDYHDSTSQKKIGKNRLIANKAPLEKPSTVFDLTGHSIGAQLNTLLTQQWLIIIAYHFRMGDIVSSNRPDLSSRLSGIIDAIAFDDALPGWAYKADAQTHSFSIDANYAFLKGHAAFNIGYEYTESHISSFNYRNNLFRVNLIYSF